MIFYNGYVNTCRCKTLKNAHKFQDSVCYTVNNYLCIYIVELLPLFKRSMYLVLCDSNVTVSIYRLTKTIYDFITEKYITVLTCLSMTVIECISSRYARSHGFRSK